VGGDICRSTVVSLAITALGEVLPQRAIYRHQAKPGDVMVVTGLHGLSRGGLELLLNPGHGSNLTAAEQQRLIEAHQRPRPRLDVLPYLREIPETIAIAGMDSSDGLADGIQQICRLSGVGAVIEGSLIPVFPALTKLVGQQTGWDWVLYGGEDFELVLCLPEPYALRLLPGLGNNAAIIGKITVDKRIMMTDAPNLAEAEIFQPGSGFQHF
jgi:thiamine-monophosphate kinase